MFVFTSCINNYIPKARVLASTLKAHHPDWTFCLLLGEAPPEEFKIEEEPFDRLMGFHELRIPNFRSWLFRHRVVEICTAAKGPALFHFLMREEHEKVMYLDPDIMVCNSLSPLETLLDEYDLLLTPHQRIPQETTQSIEDNELVALRHGVFNLGFVAVSRCGDGIAFARWWQERLLEYCYDDIPNGLFTDQRWCDLAPAFFPRLHVVRDPGYNAASWNLMERTINRTDDGIFLANDVPLRFYHFTGFDSGVGDGMTARYAANMPAVRELWKIYKQKLMASGHALLGNRRWAYMNFSDGTPISDKMRFLYRKRQELQMAFPDPFLRPGYLDWYRTEERWLPTRILRKIKGIIARTRRLLDKHGGFPRGLLSLSKQTVSWLRRWGWKGVFQRILQTHPEINPFIIKNDKERLTAVLASPDSSAYKNLAQLLDASRDPVLILEHDWGAGADIYCQRRVEALLVQNHVVTTLRCLRNSAVFELTVRDEKEGFRLSVHDIKELINERFPRIPSIIINEMAGWYFWSYNDAGPYPLNGTVERIEETVRDIELVVKAHKARLEIVFHDFFMLCPTINLLTAEAHYCGVPEDIHICDTCALRGRSFSMARWRGAFGNLLALADSVVFFSENSRDIVRKVYPLREEQIVLRPHDVMSFDTTLTLPTHGPMRIAIAGKINVHKGSKIVTELADLLAKRLPDASIVVFGELEARIIPDNITVLGAYKQSELPALMRQHAVTIGLFPSIWPETFSFVVRELAALGLPLVSFALGAQGEFVGKMKNGRLAEQISAEAALASLLELDALRIKHPLEHEKRQKRDQIMRA
ncbi:MAG: glycosyltransferase [Burkholderiales bacterium]|jgi:glycosyltransferase involved in cell wall biosynthesis|nr:glycosyltransferase [Burkholderiales bacterium]